MLGVVVALIPAAIAIFRKQGENANHSPFLIFFLLFFDEQETLLFRF